MTRTDGMILIDKGIQNYGDIGHISQKRFNADAGCSADALASESFQKRAMETLQIMFLLLLLSLSLSLLSFGHAST
jgi:hypothetical protein